MDDIDFAISSAGDFGSFQWEPTEGIKEILREFREKMGEEAFAGIQQWQRQTIEAFLLLLCGLYHSGSKVVPIAQNISRRMDELSTESLKILRS